MRTDRKADLDKYYNDHLKLHIMRRLMLVKTWSEIKGIQSAVFEALDREDKVEQAEQEAFQAWKKGGVLAAADEGLKEHKKNNE